MQLQFNAAQVQPQQPFEPVPANWYPVVLKSCEPKETKAKDGSWFLNCEFEIIDGQFRGRKLFAMLNIGNKNQQAVDIAYRELSAICHVTGRFVINDTSELLNIPFQLKASVEGSRNNVDGYKDVQGNDPGKSGAPGTAPAAAMPPAAQPPAAAQPAWGQPAAPAPAPATAAPAWGGGASAPATTAPAPAPAWQPPAAPAAGAGGPPPWARS